MRKILLSLMLCFSMLFTAVVPAFASEVTPADAESNTATESTTVSDFSEAGTDVSLLSDNGVGLTSDMPNGLMYRTGLQTPTGGIYYAVTPHKGARLRVWVKPTSGVRVSVCHANNKANILYTKRLVGEKDVQVLGNCDGGTYWVSFYNDGGKGSVDFLIYEKY